MTQQKISNQTAKRLLCASVANFQSTSRVIPSFKVMEVRKREGILFKLISVLIGMWFVFFYM